MAKKDPFKTLLVRIAEGESLRQICRRRDMPARCAVYEKT